MKYYEYYSLVDYTRFELKKYTIRYKNNDKGIALPEICSSDISKFSHLFLCTKDELYNMVNNMEDYYNTYYIPKRNGKMRRIDEPFMPLGEVQKWILHEILYRIPCSKYAKAYIPEKSVKDNARFHKRQSVVLTVDIKDFFGSIRSNHIYKIFRWCGYEESVAVLFTKLCCYEDVLPQGASTSAYLSNLVMKDFDEYIGKYCKERNIRYTRYADDMTFSGEINTAELLFQIDTELWKLGLKRNPEKLKVMRKHNRQIVTGIIVNEKYQVPRSYRMKIRQEMYYIKKYGIHSHLEQRGESEKMKYLYQLYGRIKYVLDICPQDQKMKEYLQCVKGLLLIAESEK